MLRDWLKKIRNEQDLSQSELADKISISTTMYHYIETCKRGKRISVDMAKKIADVLGFDIKMFFDEI